MVVRWWYDGGTRNGMIYQGYINNNFVKSSFQPQHYSFLSRKTYIGTNITMKKIDLNKNVTDISQFPT